MQLRLLKYFPEKKLPKVNHNLQNHSKINFMSQFADKIASKIVLPFWFSNLDTLIDLSNCRFSSSKSEIVFLCLLRAFETSSRYASLSPSITWKCKYFDKILPKLTFCIKEFGLSDLLLLTYTWGKFVSGDTGYKLVQSDLPCTAWWAWAAPAAPGYPIRYPFHPHFCHYHPWPWSQKMSWKVELNIRLISFACKWI